MAVATMKREREQFLSYLRTHGHRVTRERMRLFEAIYAHHGHLDAETLLSKMKQEEMKISRATVYRNLELLVEAGLVRKQRLGRNRFLYEHIHPGQRHDHLYCRQCGKVAEFISTGISALQIEICRAHGFVPEEHTLQITSLCSECSRTVERPKRSAEDKSLPRPAPQRIGRLSLASSARESTTARSAEIGRSSTSLR